MNSGRRPRLSQHSLPAGDLLDARLAFMFGRTAQRVGSASEGRTCSSRVRSASRASISAARASLACSARRSRSAGFGSVVVDGLGGQSSRCSRSASPATSRSRASSACAIALPETIGLGVRGSGSRAELAEFFGKRCHRGVRFMQPSQRDLDRGACLTMLLIQLALGETEPITCMTGFGQAAARRRQRQTAAR